MDPVKIMENIYWVGGIDWDLRNFHGYLTQRGSTYNAYLVIDEKITLIDTVKIYLYPELLQRVSKIIDPAKIDYIISNHVEMDHSGSIPEILKIAKNAEIISSPSGQKGLMDHFKQDWKFRVVKTGDTLNTGRYTFSFIQTPMIHWPDNMVTCLKNEKILFSNDAFGQHIATSERFDTEYPPDIIIEEARKYYANIVLPYSEQVKKALDALCDIPIDIIAPSHGLIWKSHAGKIISMYTKWANNETEKKALVIYDTMWNSTKKIAYAIHDVFEKKGYTTGMHSLQAAHISDIMTHVIGARYLCVGSPTLNSTMLPTVAAFLTYLNGLAPKGRTALSFGSYGWGGQSIGQVHDILAASGFQMLDMIRVKYIPDESQLAEIRQKLENQIQ